LLDEQYEDGQHASTGWPGQVSPLLVHTPALQVAAPQPESAPVALQGWPVARQYAFSHATHG